MSTLMQKRENEIQNQKVMDGMDVIEKVLICGDLKDLTPTQRVNYYNAVCESLSLNPLTKPFEYIILKGKLTLYALKGSTEQLRKINGVSITKVETLESDGILQVKAYACDKTGRTDISTGTLNIQGLRGEDLANALMKAETKAKRRVTLSLCGLGMLDESEIDDIPSTQKGTAYKESRPRTISELPVSPKIENKKIENKELETLDISFVLDQIRLAKSSESLQEILARARKSTLIKDKAACEEIKNIAATCEKELAASLCADWLDKEDEQPQTKTEDI